MQEETFFQSKFFNNFKREKGRLKEECTDFIVQEIYDNEVLTDKPIVNLSFLPMIDDFLNFLSKNEGMTLKEIKKNESKIELIFDKQSYSFNKPEIKEIQSDDEIKERIIEYLNKLEYEEYSFICTDKLIRKELHDLLKNHPFIYTFCDESFFKVKTCLIQNYSFILKKINKDTSDIKNLLERNLTNTIDPIGNGIFTNELLNKYDLLEDNRSNISCKVSFAGNKDKRAVTYQRMSVKCNFINLLEIDLKNVSVMDIKRSNKSINLGELIGNKFTIRVKKIKESQENESLSKRNKNELMNFSEKKVFYLNYFGMQRFGKSKNNHLVGELIHHNKIEEALELILFTYFNSRNEKDILIDLYKNKKYTGLIKLIPYSCFMERKIIFLLSKDTQNILKKLPRESLMLYLHSYQSYIFNEELNKLIDKKEVKVYLKKDDNYFLSDTYELKDAYLQLIKLNSKLAKGGYRKVLECANEFSISEEEDSFLVEFILERGCYATMFLREFFDFE